MFALQTSPVGHWTGGMIDHVPSLDEVAHKGNNVIFF